MLNSDVAMAVMTELEWQSMRCDDFVYEWKIDSDFLEMIDILWMEDRWYVVGTFNRRLCMYRLVVRIGHLRQASKLVIENRDYHFIVANIIWCLIVVTFTDNSITLKNELAQTLFRWLS